MTDAIVRKFTAIGAAALAMDIEDSHSGNISQKWTDADGYTHMAITATGSQKGDLKPTDICFPSIEGTNFGHYKASSETDIHTAILKLPGVSASMHAHTKHAMIETLNDGPKPPKDAIAPLRPIDPLGYHLIGNVPVEWFAVPSGSPEMVTKLSGHLADNPAVITHGHGVFCKGTSPDEALFRASLVENSGLARWFLRLFGVDPEAVADYIEKDPDGNLPEKPGVYSTDGDGHCDFDDEPDTAEEFFRTGHRIFESRLSPFHSGSISLRGATTILYAPKASMPRNLPGPLLEFPLDPLPGDSPELAFHKQIYANSSFQSVIHTYPAEAEAAAWSVHPEIAPECFRDSSGDCIVPIDAEGSFLYLKIPLLQPEAGFETVLRALHDYQVAVIRGRGVWAIGEQSLSEVLHHVSSARDISFYRAGASLRRLNFECLEPKNAKNW